MNDRIIFNGEFYNIRKELNKYIMHENVIELIEFINNNPKVLDIESEYLYIENEYPNPSINTMAFIVPKTNYYINMKISTIVLIAFILDIKLEKPFASTYLLLKGYPSQSVVKLNERNGEKCIVFETARKKEKQGDENILKENCRNECCNNNFNCDYCIEGICFIKKRDIIEIYNNLTAKNVFVKQGQFYKYNF